jgi:hypothetical protein
MMSRHSNARGVRKDQSAGMPRDPAIGDGSAVGGVAASFWNNVGAGMAIGGMAAAFFLDKPPGAWTKIGIAIGGFVLGWLCYSIPATLDLYQNSQTLTHPA